MSHSSCIRGVRDQARPWEEISNSEDVQLRLNAQNELLVPCGLGDGGWVTRCPARDGHSKEVLQG